MSIAVSSFSQWNNSTLNITNINELNEEQLNLSLEKANKNIRTGKVMTLVGGGAVILGAIIYSSGLTSIIDDDYSAVPQNLNTAIGGAYILYGGGLLASIGIPIWLIGESKKDQIEIALVKYKPTSYIDTNSFGIGLKLNF
jgi:hypothetical protein